MAETLNHHKKPCEGAQTTTPPQGMPCGGELSEERQYIAARCADL